MWMQQMSLVFQISEICAVWFQIKKFIEERLAKIKEMATAGPWRSPVACVNILCSGRCFI